MTSKQLGFIAIGVVLVGVLIWVMRSPLGEFAPAADEQAIVDTRPEVRLPAVDGGEQVTTEVTAALTEAEAEIERLRSELAAANALADERANAEIKSRPEAYSGEERAWAQKTRSIFEAEAVDTSWPPDAQFELLDSINKRIIDDGLAINLVDVSCRTEACRIELSFSQPPTNPSELSAAATTALGLSNQVAEEANSVSFSGLLTMRTDFPGEPNSAELFLFRSGNDGIFLAREKPPGSLLLCGLNGCAREGTDTIHPGLFR